MRRKGEAVFAASFFGLYFLNDELNIPVRQNGKLVTSEYTNPAGWPRGIEQNPTKTALAVFDVGIEKLCLNQKHCADLVILSTRGT